MKMFLMSWSLLAGLIGIVPTEVPQKSDQPVPAPVVQEKKDAPEVIKPQAFIDGDLEVEYLVKAKLTNSAKDAIVFWDINPQPAEVYESDCENVIVFTGPPGKYTVKARGISSGKKFSYTRTFTIKGGTPVPPPVPVNITLTANQTYGNAPLAVIFLAGGLTTDPVTLDYGDGMIGHPTFPVTYTYKVAGSFTATLTQGTKKASVGISVGAEPPPPEPVGKVSYFVVVEDTDKSQSWRGDILGSPVVIAAYQKLQGTRTEPVHRLISINSTSDTPEVKKYIQMAQGKDLPWIWLLDVNKQPIDVAGKKVPTVPEEFAKLIQPSDTSPRAMGNKTPPRMKYTWNRFGATPKVPLIPRSEWKEVSLAAYLPAVKDQDGQGACNAFATINAVESCRKQAGLKYVRLSCGYLYGNINDGADQGSYLEDGLAFMLSDGTCTTATIGDLEWKKGRQRPQNAVDEAKSYKVLEAYICPDFDSMASALQQGFFIVEGLSWYDNFNPDRDGWLPARGSGGVGGHALCGYALRKRGSVWGIGTRNSWASGWGVNGNCIIPESLFGEGVGGFWAVRAVTQTPTDFSLNRNPFLADDRFALAP